MNPSTALLLGAINAINDEGGHANRATIAAVVEKAAPLAGIEVSTGMELSLIIDECKISGLTDFRYTAEADRPDLKFLERYQYRVWHVTEAGQEALREFMAEGLLDDLSRAGTRVAGKSDAVSA